MSLSPPRVPPLVQRFVIADGPALDAFGGQRVSSPLTLFDSKLLHSKSALFWDEVNVGSISTHSVADSSVLMTVGDDGDYVIRQTFQRFNYQPGKTQRILLTAAEFQPVADVVKRLGYFSSSTLAPHTASFDGVYFESGESSVKVCIAKLGTINTIEQSGWNMDKMDGTGPSRITIDWQKAQIFFIDLQWLGVGRVRFGVNVAGVLRYVHEVEHANVVLAVYTSSPNQPLRYEIRSTGGASSFEHICGSVASEGGVEHIGVVRHTDTNGAFINANSTANWYALIGIRLQAAHVDTTMIPLENNVMSVTNDALHWTLMWNPTVAGTFTYADLNNDSCMQIAVGDTVGNPSTNTVTGGVHLAGGYIPAGSSISAAVESALQLGMSVAGVLDEMVLAVKPLSSNLDVYGSMSWRELI